MYLFLNTNRTDYTNKKSLCPLCLGGENNIFVQSVRFSNLKV